MSTAETTYVAFFRNVNLGRPGNPTRIQLESAFIEAGATFAESFLASGNLVYSTENNKQAQKILELARAKLKTVKG